MARSEQWWSLGLVDEAGGFLPMQTTRSRAVRDRWITSMDAEGWRVAYIECWSVGGSFTKAPYAVAPMVLA